MAHKFYTNHPHQASKRGSSGEKRGLPWQISALNRSREIRTGQSKTRPNRWVGNNLVCRPQPIESASRAFLLWGSQWHSDRTVGHSVINFYLGQTPCGHSTERWKSVNNASEVFLPAFQYFSFFSYQFAAICIQLRRCTWWTWAIHLSLCAVQVSEIMLVGKHLYLINCFS